jgi:hypothetical protein
MLIAFARQIATRGSEDVRSPTADQCRQTHRLVMRRAPATFTAPVNRLIWL